MNRYRPVRWRRSGWFATACLILVSATGFGQEPAADEQLRNAKGADLPLLKEVRLLAERIEPLADDRFSRPPVAVRSPTIVLEAGITARAARLLHADRLAARGRAWAALGLGDAQAPMDIYRWIAQDLPGCVVDEERDRLLVAEDLLADTGAEIGANEDADLLMAAGIRRDEPQMVHCLMHLRQLQRRGEPLDGSTTDGLLVSAGWSEAEAGLVAMRYLFVNLRLPGNTLNGSINPGDFLGGALLPRGLDRLGGVRAHFIRFVYLEAYAELADRVLESGWQGLGRAMSRSAGTRDLLHRDKLGRPVVQFGASSPPAEGFVSMDADILGELGVIAWVSLLTGKDSLGLETGDGWAGDRLTRWERGDRAVTDWETAWEDDDAAEDFQYAVGRVLKERFGKFSTVALDGGWERFDGPRESFAWKRDGLQIQLRIVDREIADEILPKPAVAVP